MIRRVASLLVIFALILPLLAAQNKSSDDDRIYDEVRRKLANDRDVKGAGFDVTVAKGVVTLKGRISNEKAKEKATSLTKKVKGVVSVDNQLRMFGTD